MAGRTPKNYEGTKPTGIQLSSLLSSALNQLGESFKERPDLILAAWPKIVGEKLSPMAEAVSFEGGILTIKVKNSTLLSLLSLHEKTRLLNSLRDQFPRSTIRNIIFRLG